MKKIVCPTDFSAPSMNAFTYARNLSKAMDSQLVLLHAVHPVPVVDHGFLDVPENPLADARNEAMEFLQKAGVTSDEVQIEVQNGLAADLLSSYAKKEGCDLIIMGTKGATGLKEIVLGSVASAVISKSEVPVLVVPEEARYNGIKKIIFAADFRSEDKSVTHQLVDLAKDFDAEICALHILEPDEDERDFDDREERRLAYPELFKYPKTRFEITRSRETVSGINNFAEECGADLLAMMPRNRSFFKKVFHRSITRQLACHTHIPLLAIHQ